MNPVLLGVTLLSTQWVNPFLGTGGVPWASGMLFPGATTPFGFVRLSPDTTFPSGIRVGAIGTAGYSDLHCCTFGFSHTRLSGTGVEEGGAIRVTPAFRKDDPAKWRKIPFQLDRTQELATPGYYRVALQQGRILAELTATTHVGFHRYTFAADKIPHLWIDASSFLGRGRTTEARIEINDAGTEINGEARIFTGFSGRYGGLKVYFVARPSASPTSFSPLPGQRVGLNLEFSPARNSVRTVIELKVALSAVSVMNARQNLDSEVGNRDFSEVFQIANAAWESALGKIEIETPREDIRTIFYTALYHASLMPTHFTDTNGDFMGLGETPGSTRDFTYRTDFSLWDTFRSLHPLFQLIHPEIQRDTLKSLAQMLRDGGRIPRWPSGTGYTGSMIGTPADMVIAESYLKGTRDFDAEELYSAMKTEAERSPPPGQEGRADAENCVRLGYCPDGKLNGNIKGAVSRTLEYAWADDSISKLGEALGDEEGASLFHERSLNYRNLWNPETRYFQARSGAGGWRTPFIPHMTTYLDSIFGNKYLHAFIEGSPRHWRWAVPFDTQGLIALFGNAEQFTTELEEFMQDTTQRRGAIYPGSGYWHGNEQNFHIPYLFNEAGHPEETQKWIRWILLHKYGTGSNGLDGNDDAGALSSWYVFSALGFYPVAGSERYWVGTPLVTSARLHLGNNRFLQIRTQHQSLNHPYVQSVRLNGRRLCTPSFRHQDVQNGGILEFVLGESPEPHGGFQCPTALPLVEGGDEEEGEGG